MEDSSTSQLYAVTPQPALLCPVFARLVRKGFIVQDRNNKTFCVTGFNVR